MAASGIGLAFMLSLQAGGMVVDWLGKNEQVRMGKLGADVEQAGINSNIATARLQSEDDSLQSMRQLRQNLGTQAAVFAARGVRSGTSTTALATNQSVGNFNADERMRKINLISSEAGLRANKSLSMLHQQTNQNEIWNTFRTNVAKRFPTTPEAYDQIGASFKKGFGLTGVSK